MSETTGNGWARDYLFLGWILATVLLFGVEFFGVVTIFRGVYVGPAYFRYFVPLILVLPFLAGIQAHRRIKHQTQFGNPQNDSNKKLSYYLLAVVIWSYVGFVVLLGLVSNIPR